MPDDSSSRQSGSMSFLRRITDGNIWLLHVGVFHPVGRNRKMSDKYLRTLTTIRNTAAKASDGDVMEAGLIGAACGALLGYISAGSLGLVVGVLHAGSGSAGAVALEGIVERRFAAEANLQKSVSATRVRMSRNGRAHLFTAWRSGSRSKARLQSSPSGKLRKPHVQPVRVEDINHLHKKPDSTAIDYFIPPRKTLAHK